MNTFLSTFTRGEKIFELSNHLGNVLETVNDKKIALVQVPKASSVPKISEIPIPRGDHSEDTQWKRNIEVSLPKTKPTGNNG